MAAAATATATHIDVFIYARNVKINADGVCF